MYKTQKFNSKVLNKNRKFSICSFYFLIYQKIIIKEKTPRFIFYLTIPSSDIRTLGCLVVINHLYVILISRILRFFNNKKIIKEFR